jgi:hypothetical protein
MPSEQAPNQCAWVQSWMVSRALHDVQFCAVSIRINLHDWSYTLEFVSMIDCTQRKKSTVTCTCFECNAISSARPIFGEVQIWSYNITFARNITASEHSPFIFILDIYPAPVKSLDVCKISWSKLALLCAHMEQLLCL